MDPEQASAEAIHKAKNAQQAIEFAREAQNTKMVGQIKDVVYESLSKIFGDGKGDSDEMTIIHSKIPVLCIRMNTMDANIAEIKDNQRWANRLIIGGIVSILSSIFVGVIVMLITSHLK